MPPSKRLHRDNPEWTRRKTAIEMMYVFDRLSQKKIRDKLEEDGFFVTKSELEAQLRFWKIRKNASADVWRYTDHMLLKRDQQGKASVVYYNGREVLRNTLKKERGRYQPDTLTKYTRAVSPKTPEGIELWIRTPTPAPMQSMWAHTLPWIRFQDKVLPSILPYVTNRIIDNELPHPGSLAQLSFSPLHRRFNGDPFQSISDFSIHVSSMVPEKADDEITINAQLIVQGATDQAFDEHIKLILYCLSNNMYKMDYKDESSWLAVVNLIDRSGLTNQPLDLAQQKDSTVTSIAENLFKLCIEFRHAHRSWARTSNSNVISWLLASGQNPDVELYVDDDTFSPLQLATITHDFKLAKKLLDAGADPNKCPGEHDLPLIYLLRDEQGIYLEMTPKRRDMFRALVLRLLDAGASLNEGLSDVGPSALMWAVRLDLQIADMFIQRGSKVEYQTRSVRIPITGYEFSITQSVMGFAMYNSDEEQAMRKIQHLINHLQRSHSSITVADLLPADVVCLAARFGLNEIIEYWCGSRNDTATRQHVLFSALCAASFSGYRETCELLLQYGAPIKGPERLEPIPSPLHFAALKDHPPVIELLYEYGADVNAEFKASRGYGHARNYMWNRANVRLRFRRHSTSIMIDDYSLHINPLGAAIIGAGERIPQSFETLVKYGARLPTWAVYYGASRPQHPGIVQFAVEQGGNLNWRGPDGMTPLQKALGPFITSRKASSISEFDKNDCLAILNSLVDAGAETAGSEAELIVLLEHWSHPDESSMRFLNNDSRLEARKLSTLAAVFLARSIPRIERTLAKCLGAYDPGALCAGVIFAISSGSTGPLQRLITNRPEISNGAELEGVALGLAAWHNRVDILDMLLPKIKGLTPALIPGYSYASGDFALIPERKDLEATISASFEEDILFWHRQPRDTREFFRGSPLVFSLWSQECLDKLLENDFKPDRLTLTVAVRHGEVELLEKLVHDRKWVDDESYHRPGPLYWSVVGRLEKMMRVMLEAGMSPDESIDLLSHRRTPLQQAVEDGNLEMIDLLLEYGANINAPAGMYAGATALQLAAIKGRLGIARHLVDLGADVNAPGAVSHGRTALEGAAEHGRLDMVQFLLDCGANIVGDGCLQYFKAIRFAQQEGHTVVANVLKNHREWNNFEHKTWELFTALDEDGPEELESLEELIAGSAESLSFSYEDGVSPEETVPLDDYTGYEYNSRQEGSFAEEIISPAEATWEGRSLERLENSSAALPAGTHHDNMMAEDHMASHIHDDMVWNQRSENAETGVQISLNIAPPEAAHDSHAMQGFQITDVNNQVELNQKPASANEETPAVWDPMLTEDAGNEMQLEEQLFPVMAVDLAWTQQLGAIDWNNPQTWLDDEMETGFYSKIFEGDMDRVETQDPSCQ